MLLELGNVVNASFQSIWGGVVNFAPHLFWALVIFIAGWIVGALVNKLIAHVLRAIKLDGLLEQAGFGGFLKRAGLNLNSGAFIGGLVEWFVIVVFLVAAFEVLGLYQVNAFLSVVVSDYLPQVIVVVLIVLASVVIADVLSRIVASSAKAAHMHSANLLGTITRWAIWIFALLASLVQLHIAESFINTFFTGVVVALAIAFGLAFGLGGQEAASRWIEKMREEIKSHHE